MLSNSEIHLVVSSVGTRERLLFDGKRYIYDYKLQFAPVDLVVHWCSLLIKSDTYVVHKGSRLLFQTSKETMMLPSHN